MWRQALVLSLWPLAGMADVLTFAISPTSNPAQGVSCRIEMTKREMIVVEVTGSGLPPKRPLRWPVRKAEQVAMLRAMQALISGDLPSVEAYTSRLPHEPYVTVSWSSELDGGRIAGLYIQSGLNLPPQLAQVIAVTMPGSGCQTVTQ